MSYRKLIAAAALAFVVAASPDAFAFVRKDVTNPILTPEQRANNRRFHTFDRNRDGVVTRSEWRGGSVSFARHDRNRDGVISAADRGGTAARQYAQLDRDRNGIVTRAEWRGTGDWRLYHRLDTNDDGVLSGYELY